MKALKLKVIASLLFGLSASAVLAEAPAVPSNINPDDHAAVANYYESLAKTVSEKLEASQHELDKYEAHPYTYGRQGQDLNSHLHANIREYKEELAEDLEQVELHKKMSATDQDRQFNKAKIKLDESAIQ
ncbi:hypothetical protein [Nitrosomonas sp.]|uniref:hypothetical protein n=1 Tax=Nitrosomonas sp. TaxID=42353 RepID=UPI00374DAE06